MRGPHDRRVQGSGRPDPTRRLILDELADRDGRTLFEICSLLISRHGVDSSRQAISQHLAVLEEAGLVTVERRGRSKAHHLDRGPLVDLTKRWLAAPSDPPSDPPSDHGRALRIHLTSVYVDDQRAALDFYTDVLDFEVRHDIPLGEDTWWLTVGSPEDPAGAQLLLEPAGHPAAGPYRAALVEDGIPLAQFAVDDVRAEHQRLADRGVVFTQLPTDLGDVTMAVFDDTCGNLIQIVDRT